MRMIGQLASEPIASQLRDCLNVRGIESQVEHEEDGTFSLWVMEEAQVAPAKDLMGRFLADPQAAEFAGVADQAARRYREQARAEASRRSTVADVERLQYERSHPGIPYVTYALILISVAVAIYSNVGENKQALRPLFISTLYAPEGMDLAIPFLPEVRAGQLWRLVTPIFIHFGYMHIVFNMLMLKDLGTFIEERFNGRYLLLLVLAGAILSNTAQYFISGPHFGGMSGVDYALFGFLWMRGKHDRFSDWQLNRNTVNLLIGWFVLCLVNVIPDVANTAHAAGLAAGMAWGYLSAKRPFSR